MRSKARMVRSAILCVVVSGCPLECPSDVIIENPTAGQVGPRVGVNTNTTGTAVPAQYTATLTPLGSGSSQTKVVQANQQGMTTFTELAYGGYLLGLEIPENCAVQGENPISITVDAANSNKFYNFDIVCYANVGGIRVFNDTNGDPTDVDPGFEHYEVTVADAGLSLPFPPDFNIRFDDVPVGDHDVEIFGVPDGCLLFGDPVRSVTVEFGQEANVAYAIDCSGENGVLRVVTATTGVDVDPDGYLVNVAGMTIGFSNDFTYDFVAVPAGDHEVTLYDLAPNCAVDGDNPRTVTVEAAQTAVTTFDVVCVAITGSLQVTATTSGEARASGYEVTVDGQTVSIGANETHLIEGITPGDQQVTLDLVPEACSIAGENPRTVSIPPNGSAATTFEVSCPPPPPSVIFESDRDGDWDIYGIGADGDADHPVNLTGTGASDGVDQMDPSWSWDNQRIIFRRAQASGPGDIWVMNADGTNPVQITDTPEDNQDPAFSPDGTKIVYEQEIGVGTGDLEIFIADADGGNPMQLTSDAGVSEAPSFSPDGTRLLFKSDRDGDFDVYTQDLDGLNKNVVKLTPDTPAGVDDFDPSWSPDGTQIIFSSQRAMPVREDIWIMNADGSGARQLLFDAIWDWHPVFSTDGTQIVFTSDRDGDYELFRMNADGSGVVQLTHNTSTDDDAEYRKPIS